MSDVRAEARMIELAARQFNRVARGQLLAFGMTASQIDGRLASGRLVVAEEGVYAIAPLLDHDQWGRWKGVTLTALGSVLSHFSAAAARKLWTPTRAFDEITRPGNGGPTRHGGVRAYRSETLEGDVTDLHGIPITTAQRTILDIAPRISDRALARAVREAVREKQTSLAQLADVLGKHRGRRGAGRLGEAIARYSGLPLARARSGTEVHAMEALRDARRSIPALNEKVEGEEADLIWRSLKLIIEIDGGPWHLDRGRGRAQAGDLGGSGLGGPSHPQRRCRPRSPAPPQPLPRGRTSLSHRSIADSATFELLGDANARSRPRAPNRGGRGDRCG